MSETGSLREYVDRMRAMATWMNESQRRARAAEWLRANGFGNEPGQSREADILDYIDTLKAKSQRASEHIAYAISECARFASEERRIRADMVTGFDNLVALRRQLEKANEDIDRLTRNEAPLRAGYLEACAERDALREQVKGTAGPATTSLQERDAQEARRQAKAMADYASRMKQEAGVYHEQAETLIDQMAKVEQILATKWRPRVKVKRLLKARGLR